MQSTARVTQSCQRELKHKPSEFTSRSRTHCSPVFAFTTSCLRGILRMEKYIY